MRSPARAIGALLGSTALLTATAGCSALSSDDESQAARCDAPAANTDDSAVTGEPKGEITFQTQGLKKDFAHFFDGVIAEFEKKYPDTEIKWTDVAGGDDFDTRMLTDAQNCTLPDVLNVPSTAVQALTNADALLDLDVKAPGIGDGVVPSLWKSLDLSDTQGHTALPWYWAPSVLTYNKTLMREAGLDPDDPPATVEELYEDALKIAENTDGEVKAIWGNPAWTYADQWFSMGVKAMNDDLTEFTFGDDPAALTWLTGLVQAYEAGAVPADSITGAPDPSQAFTEGNLVFGSPNPSFLRNVKTNAPKLYPDTGVAPGLRKEGQKTPVAAQYLTVPVGTDNAETALAFTEFLTNEQNQLAWCKDPGVVIFPTNAKALQDDFFTGTDADDPLGLARRHAAEAAADSTAYPALFYFNGAINTEILKEVQFALQGSKSPQQALTDAQKSANGLLDSAQKK